PSSFAPRLLLLHCSAPPRDLHSFPTRRSSDLAVDKRPRNRRRRSSPRRPRSMVHRSRIPHRRNHREPAAHPSQITYRRGRLSVIDRKSTRLNSSHVSISYAVFCLKKKNKRKDT